MPIIIFSLASRLLGVNENCSLSIFRLLTKYKLLYVSNQGRVGVRARVGARPKG